MENEGQIITVSGPIDPAEAGITLMHEHMLFAGFWLFDYSAWVDSEGQSGFDERFDLGMYGPVTRENAVWLRYHPYVNRENLVNTDWRLSATELRRFKLAGGGTIVDASPRGRRDVWALRKISEDVGMHVVAGTGYYVEKAHPWDTDEKTVAQLSAEFVQDIARGADGTSIRCGIMGEIGTSDPVTKSEWKVLEACAAAHQETGAAIQVHSAHATRSMPRIIEFLTQAGVHPSRVIACHLDLVHDDWDYTIDVADSGVFIEYDGFGHLQPLEGVPARDRDRVAALMRLFESDRHGRLLLSHDIGLRSRFAEYGGPGWSYILTAIIPRLRAEGVPVSVLRRILEANPQRALALSKEVGSSTRTRES